MTTLVSEILRTDLDVLNAYWRRARLGGYPAALWRLPKQSDRHLVIDGSAQNRRLKIDLEEVPMGFAISPFLNPNGTQTRFLRADVYLRLSDDGTAPEELRTVLGDRLVQVDWTETPPPQREARPVPDTTPGVGENEFEGTVAHAIAEIEAGTFQKVVLSRTKTAELPADFEVLTAFNRLCAAYPNAFVSLVSLPDEGTYWLGATPETLVSVDAAGEFRTVSLAGTQSATAPDGSVVRPGGARWSQKEIEEQALVSRYIIECFKKIRLREYVENGPKTVQAGNLLHLRTDFCVDTRAVHFPQLGTVMLDLLHPTSAVCGLPKAPALAFIQRHEGYDRSYYSGYLGPVNVGGETHLFVNLRTMKIDGARATLYAGAGITEDSDPHAEWLETELKCQTLLGVV
jgi:isochorismate synthase